MSNQQEQINQKKLIKKRDEFKIEFLKSEIKEIQSKNNYNIDGKLKKKLKKPPSDLVKPLMKQNFERQTPESKQTKKKQMQF